MERDAAVSDGLSCEQKYNYLNYLLRIISMHEAVSENKKKRPVNVCTRR